MRNPALARLALFAWIATACATPASPPPVGPVEALLHDSPWQKSEVRGIEVYSNASPERTRRLLDQLSRFLDLVDVVQHASFHPDRPAVLLLFARDAEWHRFAPANIHGHTRSGPGPYQVGLSIEQYATGVLQHEVVHLVLFTWPGRGYPRWYHEGLAEVLSSAVIREDVAVVGSVPTYRREELKKLDPLPLAEVLSDRAAQSAGDRFYADAFAFVHWAVLGGTLGGKKRLSEFNRFVRLVHAGEAWRQAFGEAFSDDFAVVEKEYLAHRAELAAPHLRPRAVIELTGNAPHGFDLEPVGDPEMARTLASFGTPGVLDQAVADGLWQRVQAAAPDDVEAHLGRARAAAALDRPADGAAQLVALPPSERHGGSYELAAAEVAVAAYQAATPHDGAEALEQLRNARLHYQAVLAETPDDFEALLGLGHTYVLDETSAPADGIAVFQRADDLWHAMPRVQLGLAELRVRMGEYARARALLSPLLVPGVNDEMQQRAEKLVAEIERREKALASKPAR